MGSSVYLIGWSQLHVVWYRYWSRLVLHGIIVMLWRSCILSLIETATPVFITLLRVVRQSWILVNHSILRSSRLTLKRVNIKCLVIVWVIIEATELWLLLLIACFVEGTSIHHLLFNWCSYLFISSQGAQRFLFKLLSLLPHRTWHHVCKLPIFQLQIIDYFI